MKSLRLIVVMVILAAAVATAACADGFTLEVGAVGAALNVFSSAQQKPGAPTAITSNANLVPDPYVNGSYAMKLDSITTARFGLRAEDMMGTISPSFVNMARVEPYADLLSGPWSVRVSFPLYFLSPDTKNDPKYAELKYLLDYAYKGISLGTYFNSGMNTFLLTNYESVAYKLSFDKTTALVFSASTEIGLSPAWLYDLKPQISFIYGPFQLDLQEAIYFADQGSTTPSFSDATYNLRLYTGPKVTFDCGSVGVPGLKVYFQASLYTYDTYPNGSTPGSAFYGGSSGSAVAKGSSLYPGIIYSTGPLYVEAIFKIHNYDDSNTDGLANVNPTFDPSLKVSYTVRF
ncbi:MAG TPA: hypothetical protein VL354_03745 [Spirochaetia bacterium]|nr:hypothetical protein [Spirochaetia bacterium]